MATNSTGNIAQSSEVIVAVIPFPEHGHVNQIFTIACFVDSYNISLHFLCLNNFNQHLKSLAPNINFHDLLLSSGVKDSTNNEGGDANDGATSIDVLLKKLTKPISQACLELSNNAKRLVIIHDSIMMRYMEDHVFTLSNVTSYAFHSGSAFTRYSMLRQSMDNIDDDQEHNEMVQQMHEEFPTLESSFGPVAKWLVRMGHERKLNTGELMNTCRELDGKYVDSFANAKQKPVWALGPFHMLLESPDLRTQHECLEFLDKQDVNSVIYVSIEAITKLSVEQVKELALGLEQSNHRFIWLLKKVADAENIELPEGFEERVKGRGIVVRNSAPQLEILGHQATGGFLSDCGWTSCLESISMGVPLAAWPIHFDQPYDAILVTKFLKVATIVRSWTRREELVTAATVETVVKTLMGSTEGEEIRQRVVQLSNKIKSSVSPGGRAREEMKSFISQITK